MKNVLLFLSLLLLPTAPALADRVLEFSDAKVVFLEKPCSVGLILAEVDSEVKKRLKQGKVEFIDKTLNRPDRDLCWLEEDDTVYWVDETGFAMMAPSSALKSIIPKNKSI